MDAVRASMSARASSSHRVDASSAACSLDHTPAPAGPVAIRTSSSSTSSSSSSSSSRLARRLALARLPPTSSSSISASTALPSCSGLTFRTRPLRRVGSVGGRFALRFARFVGFEDAAGSGPFHTKRCRGGVQRRQMAFKSVDGGD
eukprot:31385-Pelagococcus_subviridis.AAC.11